MSGVEGLWEFFAVLGIVEGVVSVVFVVYGSAVGDWASSSIVLYSFVYRV